MPACDHTFECEIIYISRLIKNRKNYLCFITTRVIVRLMMRNEALEYFGRISNRSVTSTIDLIQI